MRAFRSRNDPRKKPNFENKKQHQEVIYFKNLALKEIKEDMLLVKLMVRPV